MPGELTWQCTNCIKLIPRCFVICETRDSHTSRCAIFRCLHASETWNKPCPWQRISSVIMMMFSAHKRSPAIREHELTLLCRRNTGRCSRVKEIVINHLYQDTNCRSTDSSGESNDNLQLKSEVRPRSCSVFLLRDIVSQNASSVFYTWAGGGGLFTPPP